jgi:hypothetical protein
LEAYEGADDLGATTEGATRASLICVSNLVCILTGRHTSNNRLDPRHLQVPW